MSAQAAVIEQPVAARPSRRTAFAGAWVVSASMLASGLLIYAFHVGAARALGAAAYGQIATLWAAMFLAVIVVFRPLEQATSRGIADRLARGDDARPVVRSVAALSCAALGLIVLLMALTWEAIGDRLFLGDSAMTAFLLIGIVSYGIAYVARGVVAGVRWFSGYGVGLIVDSVARLLIAVPLLFVASLEVAAAAVTVAGLIGGVAPLLAGRERLRPIGASDGGDGFRVGRTIRFAMPASAIAAVDQLLVNCSPLLVMLEGGSAETAGLVFAATMLVRVPVYVFQGLASAILPNLTHLHVAEASARRFRRAIAETAAFFLAAGVLIVGFAAVAGPESLRIVYGPDFEAGRTAILMLGAGVAFYLCATTFSQALLALEASARAASAWIAAAVLFVALYFGLDGSALDRVSLAFAAATLFDLVLLALLLHRKTRAL
jgi:O-antigen/teichoic acid export membrane protein